MLSHTSAHPIPIELGTVGGRSWVVQDAIGMVARVLENAASNIWVRKATCGQARHVICLGAECAGLVWEETPRIEWLVSINAQVLESFMESLYRKEDSGGQVCWPYCCRIDPWCAPRGDRFPTCLLAGSALACED